MLSIRGVYTGNEIKPLENISVRANVQVIITFLDEEKIETDQQRKSNAIYNDTQIFLDKCQGWEDSRSPEEIITEIYTLRTSSDRKVELF
jgi:hypothetical protein